MARRRAALLSTAALVTVAAGVALIAMTPGADRLQAGGRAVPVLTVVVGWGFVALGLAAAVRRPDSPLGLILGGFGLSALLSGFYISNAPLPFLLATVADPLATAIFVHLLLVYPSGRVQDAAARVVVRALYTVAAGGALITVLFDAGLGEQSCADCPRNPLLIVDAPALASTVQDLQRIVGLALALAALVLVARRWRAAGAIERRGYAPLLVAGAGVLALGLLSAATQDLDASADVQRVAQLVFIAAFALLPAAFLVGLVRSRFFRTATVGRVLERLTAEPRPEGIGAALGAALGDPDVAVAHWLEDRGAYVDREGRPFALPDHGDGRVATELTHQGRRVGVLVHGRELGADPALLTAATDAAALAVVNERLEVELRAQVEALRVSRARIVQTADAERRRLTRDLHDGAQQRLVALLIDLQLAHDRADGDARGLVGSALGHAREAVAELRDLASGIHPAVLSQRGLDAAVETLAARSPVPVELELRITDRLPSAMETAAYFVVAEALTNVTKYAEATHARVGVRRERGDVVVEVVDDGVGGAHVNGGTGLLGLADRVGALDGTLEVRSPPGLGTVVRARFPGIMTAMRVVIAEDQVLLRQGIVRLLGDHGFDVVAEAGDAPDLLRKVAAHKPDVAIVDVQMPPGNADDGLRAAIEIRARQPDVGVLVLSQFVEQRYAVDLIGESASGGVGYLLKDRVSDFAGFADAVRRVGSGGSALDPAVVSEMLGRRRRDDPLEALTPRERDVLELMAQGRSNRGIAEALVVTPHAVEKHVTGIFAKLGVGEAPADHRRVQAVLAFLRA